MCRRRADRLDQRQQDGAADGSGAETAEQGAAGEGDQGAGGFGSGFEQVGLI
jgi:hypothetical protein